MIALESGFGGGKYSVFCFKADECGRIFAAAANKFFNVASLADAGIG